MVPIIAVVHKDAAARVSSAILGDLTAVHRERAAIFDIYAAAILCHLITGDLAAVHRDTCIVINVNTSTGLAAAACDLAHLIGLDIVTIGLGLGICVFRAGYLLVG